MDDGGLWVLIAAMTAGAAAWVALASPPGPGRPAHRAGNLGNPFGNQTGERTGDRPGDLPGDLPGTAVPSVGPSAVPAPSTVPLRAVAAVAAGAAGLLLVPGAVGIAVGAAVAGAVWWRSQGWESAGERRRRERLVADLPHVVDLLVSVLESGAAPEAALDRVARVVGGPVAAELSAWLAHLRLGTDPVQVWAQLAHHPELGRLGRALHRAAESGAPVATALSRLADELRASAQAEVEETVRQVEVRAAVPLAVCMLPSFLLLGVVPLVAGSVSGLVLAP